MTEKDKATESTRRGIAFGLVATVLAVALGGAAFLFWRRARSSEDTLEHVRSTWHLRQREAPGGQRGSLRCSIRASRPLGSRRGEWSCARGRPLRPHVRR